MILRDNFDAIFTSWSANFWWRFRKHWDVNQGLEGMQEKIRWARVADVGIREATIIGQGIEWH
jgi:hypothetical protein